MWKVLKISLFFILMTYLCLSGWSMAASDGFEERPGFGLMPPPPPPHGIHLLMKYQMDNVLIKVIADKSGQDVETIKSDFEERDIPSLLREYGIDATEFHLAVSAKMIELVNAAKADGRITEEQATYIIESINAHPAP